MDLIGLDLNATRARAAHGPAGGVAAPLALEEGSAELPLVLRWDERSARVGRTGASRCRSTPHLVWQDFLPFLGQPQQWGPGRLRFDAAGALGLVFEALGRVFTRVEGIACVLPDYLTDLQVEILNQVAHKARWRLLGTLPQSLAAALAAQAHLPWPGILLVVDLDGFALTCSAVSLTPGQAVVVTSRSNPRLGLGVWLGRMLDGVANRCVRISRRDPRQSPEADQALYTQLARLVEAQVGDGLIELSLQTAQWSQHLMLRPAELAGFCGTLVPHATALVQTVLTEAGDQGPLAGIVLTSSARGLPGLAGALEHSLERLQRSARRSQEMDFGEHLLSEALTPCVHPLEPEAISRVAHEVAGRMAHGDCPQGHVLVAPALARDIADPGPARLHFRGRDHFLSTAVFTLGRALDCSLVFESELYPTVSARHCDIFLDRRAYTLRDRSRHGTLVNEQPIPQQARLQSGDHIRLGPLGPVVQFLGR